MKRLRAGTVVRLRVNPRDCLSCIDIAKQIGIYTKGMSFSAVVSLALSSMLEACRQQEIIPTRDGFEYDEMMAPFKEEPIGARAKKLEISKTIYDAGSDVRVASVLDQRPIVPVNKQQAVLNEIRAICNAQGRKPDEQDILRLAQAVKDNLLSQGAEDISDEDIIVMARGLLDN